MTFKRSMVILIVIVALSVLHLSIYTRNMNIKYQLEGLKRDFGELQKELREMEAVSAKKKDLDRIESIATKKLKMIRPKEVNYIKSSATERPSGDQ